MKCVDCGADVKEEKQEREVKVTLNNPGTVFFKAKTTVCKKCGTHYIDEEDMKEASDAFEKACSKKK